MEIINPTSDPETSGIDSTSPSPETAVLPEAARLQEAGFLRRALAFSLDLVLIGFLYLTLLLVGALGVHAGAAGGRVILFGDPISSLTAPFILVGPFLFISYFTFFHSYGGQTPAKKLIRIKVVSTGGASLTPWQALARSFGYFLSTFFFGFGFFLSIFEKKGRALHDLLTRSQVILS